MADVAPIVLTPKSAAHLSIFDELLSHGPDYGKLAMLGGVAGAAAAFLSKRRLHKELHPVRHYLGGAAVGAGLATLGAMALFRAGKAVSERAHEASLGVASPSSARAGFWPGGRDFGRRDFGAWGGGGWGGGWDRRQDWGGGWDQRQDQDHPFFQRQGW